VSLKSIQQENNFITDKDSVHSYLEYYDTIFSVYKDKDINLLEIGIDKGGSLLLWNKYFTPNSNLYGMDVYMQPNLSSLEYIENITVLYKNAYKVNKNFLNGINFDIIIDDGSHYLHDQITAFEVYKNKLTKGGIFVIEDLQPEGVEYFTKISQTISNCKIVDLRFVKDRYDDMLFVYSNN
jgi:hypothetical protein